MLMQGSGLTDRERQEDKKPGCGMPGFLSSIRFAQAANEGI